MRYKLIIVLGLLSAVFVNAQVTNEGFPKSWGMQKAKKSIAPILMKSIDFNKIKAEDAINDKKDNVPFRFGHELGVDLGLDNAGVWDELANGDRIWRTNIVSKGATTLNFIFNEFKIPKGATLYLYNDDKSDVLGAYTDVFNRPDKMLGTWLIEGDNIWIEYYEPVSVKGQGKLNISKVIHGYRSVTDAMVRQKDLGSSDNCNHDVDCTIGNDFDALKDQLKRSVALFILGGGVCSGTLINNTSNDRAPYFLSANHCFVNNDTGQTDNPATWAFRFNWISPNPSCGTTASSTDGDRSQQTTSGATILARNEKTDMLLVNIDTGLPEEWNLNWAGWDRSGNVPRFVVGIHHPEGDIMKVCRESDPPTKSVISFNGEPQTEIWEIADWDIGVTERGSSGSTIFDPSGRIIGQLAGGGAACSGLDDNGLPDFYGRFDVSWDFGTTDATRLSNWLDPTNTGDFTADIISQDGTVPPTPTPPAPEEREEVIVFFNPSEAKVTISNTITNNIITYSIYDISGALVDSGQITGEEEEIDMTSKSSGMYFVFVENSVGGSFVQKVVVNQRF